MCAISVATEPLATVATDCHRDEFLFSSLPPSVTSEYCTKQASSITEAVLNRRDEEVAEQEELDEISENEAEEEEEFCAGKLLWETEESLNSHPHVEMAVKVKFELNFLLFNAVFQAAPI